MDSLARTRHTERTKLTRLEAGPSFYLANGVS